MTPSLRLTWVTSRPGHGAVGDGVVVVLAGDLDRTVRHPAHRVVAAVVAERQLVGSAAEGGGQQLMAEADPEHRHLAEQAADGVDGVTDRRRVARAVGEEHPVGLAGQHRRGRGGRRHHLDGGQATQVAQDGAFDPEVVGDHPQRPVADGVRLGGGHLGRQVDAVGARGRPGRLGNDGLVQRRRAR